MRFLYDGEEGGGFLSGEVVVPGELQCVVVQVHDNGLFRVFPPGVQVENVRQHSEQNNVSKARNCDRLADGIFKLT